MGSRIDGGTIESARQPIENTGRENAALSWLLVGRRPIPDRDVSSVMRKSSGPSPSGYLYRPGLADYPDRAGKLLPRIGISRPGGLQFKADQFKAGAPVPGGAISMLRASVREITEQATRSPEVAGKPLRRAEALPHEAPARTSHLYGYFMDTTPAGVPGELIGGYGPT